MMLFSIVAEKIAFPPKPDIHTDRQTDGHYRVALLLQNMPLILKLNSQTISPKRKFDYLRNITERLTDGVIY